MNVHLEECLLKIRAGIVVFLPSFAEAAVLLPAIWLVSNIELLEDVRRKKQNIVPVLSFRNAKRDSARRAR